MRTLPTHDDMIRAFETSDTEFDGLFVTAVKTTGIFCRPSCRGRKPRRENVEFFASPREALTAGYRPCKRCRPMNDGDDSPEWLSRLLELAEGSRVRRLTDHDLRTHDIDPIKARRYFKSHHGMTWQAYHRALRLGSALAHLRRGEDLNGTGLGHGFESASGFREAFVRLFGAPPGAGRSQEMLTLAWIESPIGAFIAGAVRQGICLLEFADRRALERQIRAVKSRFGMAAAPGRNEHLERVGHELHEYFAGTLIRFRTPVVMRGTEFQEGVWRALLRIPFGETRSYDDVARAIGHPSARRAVGRANGQNPVAILVPCHRVIGADGKLTGYGGGLWRKQFLLDHERTVASRSPRQQMDPRRESSWSSSESGQVRNGKARSATAARSEPALVST